MNALLMIIKVAIFVVCEIGLGIILKTFFIKEKDGLSVCAAIILLTALAFTLTIVGKAVNSEATAMVAFGVYMYAMTLAAMSYILGVKISEIITPKEASK